MVVYQVRISRWNIEEEVGYKPMTTFWEDFSIADRFGYKAVEETYRSAFREWKDDYRYLTELVLVLNHKAWQHVDTNPVLSDLYVTLYEVADNYAIDTLKGEHLKYFFKVTD